VTRAGRLRVAVGVVVLAAATCALVVAHPRPAAAAPGLVQTGSVVASANKTLALTLPAASTSGNLLIAVMSAAGDSTSPSAPGGWSQAITGSGGQARRVAIYYYTNNPGGISSATFTFGTNTTFAAGQLLEWSGMATLSPVDVTARTSAASAASVNVNGNQTSGNNSNTSYANEIEVTAFVENLSSMGTVTFTPGSGWTNIGNTGATPGTNQYTADYQTGLANGALPSETQTSSVTSSATGWEAAIATFAPLPTCTGGSLTLTPQSVQFNSATLNGLDKTVTTSNNPTTLTPSDQRGSGAGWNITLTSTQFTTGTRTLSTSATTLTSVNENNDAGTCIGPTNSVTGYPITVPAGAGPPTAVKIYNAAANTGEGDAQVTVNFSLALPASAFAGHYTSTWTFTIATGP
jgi:hypothetical protein